VDRLLPRDDCAAHQAEPPRRLFARLFSRRAAAMLGRNTVVSCFVFAISFALLWLLVAWFGMNELLAATIGFIVANTIHHALGRTWIFRGTDRAVASGYIYFVASGGLGLGLTILLYGAFLHFTSLNYLVARVLVSVFAGLAMFVLNATFNFHRL